MPNHLTDFSNSLHAAMTLSLIIATGLLRCQRQESDREQQLSNRGRCLDRHATFLFPYIGCHFSGLGLR